MSAKYLIRLDDACPTFTLEKWNLFFDLFDSYGIKPIVAVIPDNKDKSLEKEIRSVDSFWSLVRDWEKKGYCIAIHGYDHKYLNSNSGLLKLTKHSEFAGLSYFDQKNKLTRSIKIFESHGLSPKVFVAPSHSFDETTIKVLRNETHIRIISDGIFTKPVLYNSMKWIPCQLWYPKVKKRGVWTICVHPETISENDFSCIKRFIEKYKCNFIDVANVSYSRITIYDYIYKYLFYLKRNKFITNVLKLLKNA